MAEGQMRELVETSEMIVNGYAFNEVLRQGERRQRDAESRRPEATASHRHPAVHQRELSRDVCQMAGIFRYRVLRREEIVPILDFKPPRQERGVFAILSLSSTCGSRVDAVVPTA